MKFMGDKNWNIDNCSIVNNDEVNFIKMTPEGVELWNEIIKSGYGKGFIYTEKGYISKCKENYRHYELYRTGSIVKVMYYLGDNDMIMMKIGENKAETRVKPQNCWKQFKDKCEEYGVDLKKYKTTKEMGNYIRSEIQCPYIFNSHFDETLQHCYHLDLHSAYPSGIVNSHPEFKPVFEFFYNNRKSNPQYKLIPDIAIGWMQRKNSPVYASLAKDAIHYCNKTIEELSQQLEAAGYEIIGCNTDGIWYQDKNNLGAFHNDTEGDGLCHWRNDHFDCQFRAKSDGAYEYIENGQYHCVARGQLTKDLMGIPRSEWKWGDVYNNEYTLMINEMGVIYYEEKQKETN